MLLPLTDWVAAISTVTQQHYGLLLGVRARPSHHYSMDDCGHGGQDANLLAADTLAQGVSRLVFTSCVTYVCGVCPDLVIGKSSTP